VNKLSPLQTPTAAACPVCGDASASRLLCKVDGFDILACATCGAEYATPVPTPAALKAYYDRPEWFEGGERGGYKNYDAQTDWSLGYVTSILDSFGDKSGLSILDVGCGYGTHLKLAAERGWKCFGVEVSDHARRMAQDRLGNAAYVVESVEDLIPHEFDLVLILDTLEHLPSPYTLLYSLFSIGAITAKTRVVISTPNAGSADAVQNPAAWAYRHPPSHLVFYKAETLTYLLKRLHFTNVNVQGLAPNTPTTPAHDLTQHAGLLVTASGSDFTEFMRERYVPGTWSKIAEYEHVPRYNMTLDLIAGKRVLDFGCGTGYGSAMMALHAAEVTGLDIDAAAIAWATETHRKSNLKYIRRNNLGADLPAASFDVITCFEMIEHVDHATQQAVIASFARLLKPGGTMLISTPNPETTKQYGENPYHIREMNEAELRELVAPHFPSVQILRQYVRTGVTLDQAGDQRGLKPLFSTGDAPANNEPLAFIGVCSNGGAVPAVPSQIIFDGDVDYISEHMRRQNTLNKVRLQAYLQAEAAANYKLEAQNYKAEAKAFSAERDKVLAAYHNALGDIETFTTENQRLTAERDNVTNERNLAQQERDQAREAFHHLTLRRNHELSSPRFLLRRFLGASRTRVLQKLSRAKRAAIDLFDTSHYVDHQKQVLATEQSLAALMARPPAMAATQQPFLCTLLIPTKNGGPLFKRVVAGLQRQTIWPRVEFIVIDSGSTDDTIATAEAAGAKVISIPPAEFNHGATRDRAIATASCEKIVLTVQDAIPAHEKVLEDLIAPLDDATVAGCYARQIPQPDADFITKRNLNAWLTGRDQKEVRSLKDAATYDAMSPMEKYLFSNFDNVCSVIRKSVWETHKFGRINFGEDIDWAERALKSGHKIVYEPAAAVVHSHDRPIAYEYKRTYVCHRKLYSQFGLHVVSTPWRIPAAWFHTAMADMCYVVKVKAAWTEKMKLLGKIPVLVALQVIGQYQGARDEKRGSTNTVKGV
jgi:2-polyprenyl-3-methyl-5-hydroxy-6-metoxy-1,4-benzoquinol methylase/glycosyltransferase involved in cell wall biosynthesis